MWWGFGGGEGEEAVTGMYRMREQKNKIKQNKQKPTFLPIQRPCLQY